jgi:hypothetical protein
MAALLSEANLALSTLHSRLAKTEDDRKEAFCRAVNYQASIIALQLFLQHYVTRDYSVVYKDILQFYLRHCPTLGDFLNYRTVLLHHEDDERDGSEDDTPLTCVRAQEVFENVEAFMYKNTRADSKKPDAFLIADDLSSVDPELVLNTPEFKTLVDFSFGRIDSSYDAMVFYVAQQLFPSKNGNKYRDTDFNLVIDAVKCIVRAGVLSTNSFYDAFDDEKPEWDQFYIRLNADCSITEVGFASFDDCDLTDLDLFADRVIISRTDNDSRLRHFYEYATYFVREAFETYLFLQKHAEDTFNRIVSETQPLQTTTP